MTVAELIEKLQKIENQNGSVEFADADEEEYFLVRFVFADENGAILCDIPPTWEFEQDELTKMEII